MDDSKKKAEKKPTGKSLLNLKEAAEMLGGVDPMTVRRMIKTGRLPGVKIHIKSVRVRRQDIEKYISDEIVRWQIENGTLIDID